MEQDIPLSQIGLYLHIPWCIKRCGYCSFFAEEFRRKEFEDYVATLLKEKQLYLQEDLPPLDTVYFGGGTPSLLSGDQISAILQNIPIKAGAEITLEINPIQINHSFAKSLADTPINRISLGVQSMLDEDLNYLGRRHRAGDISDKVQILRNEGFHNISADFIYGLPGSTLQNVEQSLLRLLVIPFEHISCYLLELYEDTPLGRDADLLPNEEECEAQYQLITRLLAESGFKQYEISNFARPGMESRHNLIYWEGGDFLAWGASASGYYRGKRYQNPADLTLYQAYIDAGKIYGDFDPEQDPEKDYLMMRLRLTKGIDFKEFRKRFGHDFREHRTRKIDQLRKLEMIALDEDSLRLTLKAFFISNSVIAELL